MIKKELLEVICCPETKQDLKLADQKIIDQINKLIEKKELFDRSEKSIEGKIDGGLIREDKKFLYPIKEEIPVLLIEESISLEKIEL